MLDKVLASVLLCSQLSIRDAQTRRRRRIKAMGFIEGLFVVVGLLFGVPSILIGVISVVLTRKQKG